MPKSVRETGGFIGDTHILPQINNGVPRKLTAIQPTGRAPMRAGTKLFDSETNEIGVITSGGFSPSLQAPIAMGYVSAENAKQGTSILAQLRGKMVEATIAKLPFVPHGYKK